MGVEVLVENLRRLLAKVPPLSPENRKKKFILVKSLKLKREADRFMFSSVPKSARGGQ